MGDEERHAKGEADGGAEFDFGATKKKKKPKADADEAEKKAGGDAEEEQGDACIQAMAAFVSESREWALGVQGFLLQHCRAFVDTEENRLEWQQLHGQ